MRGSTAARNSSSFARVSTISTITGRSKGFFASYIRNPSARDIIASYKTTPPGPWGPRTVQLANGQELEKVHLWINNATSGQYVNHLWAAWKKPFGPNLELKFSFDNGAIWRGVDQEEAGEPIQIDQPQPQFPEDKPEGVNLHTGPHQSITSVYGTWTLSACVTWTVHFPWFGPCVQSYEL